MNTDKIQYAILAMIAVLAVANYIIVVTPIRSPLGEALGQLPVITQEQIAMPFSQMGILFLGITLAALALILVKIYFATRK